MTLYLSNKSNYDFRMNVKNAEKILLFLLFPKKMVRNILCETFCIFIASVPYLMME